MAFFRDYPASRQAWSGSCGRVSNIRGVLPLRKQNIGTPTDGINLDRFVNSYPIPIWSATDRWENASTNSLDREMFEAAAALYLFLPGILMVSWARSSAPRRLFCFSPIINRSLAIRFARAGWISTNAIRDGGKNSLGPGFPIHKRRPHFSAKIDWEDAGRNAPIVDLS